MKEQVELNLKLLNNKNSLRKLSGNKKKVYKYIMVGIFTNIIRGKDDTLEQLDLYAKAEQRIF